MIDTIYGIITQREFRYFGIRVVTNQEMDESAPVPAVGDTLTVSYVWDNDESTGEELDGTSVVGIGTIHHYSDELTEQHIVKAIEQSRKYFGSAMLLVGSDTAQTGDDPGEMVMRDAIVLAILEATT